MKSTKKSLAKRGFTDKVFDAKFTRISTLTLITLLKSKDPQERTAAAKLLGNRKETCSIQALCQALAQEKKLYPKIAISEALGNIGKSTLPYLIALLGKIGKNQHKSLPAKLFAKKNYPCPRDIAARTIIKIGAQALPHLEEIIINGTATQIAEAIDAIGYIAFYSKNLRSLKYLQQCLKKYRYNHLITWKIIRAFESFPIQPVIKYLKKVKHGENIPALRREATRSLEQIKYWL